MVMMETQFEISPKPTVYMDSDNKFSGNGGGGRFRNKAAHTSYAQLITMAINGADEKRLTLSEIYEWMAKNVPGLYEQRFLHSSKGWKNAVRHTLSINPRFYKVGRVGRPGWWALDTNFQKKSRTAPSSPVSSPPFSEQQTVPGPVKDTLFRSRRDTVPKIRQRYGDSNNTPMSAQSQSHVFNFDLQVVEVASDVDGELSLIPVPNPMNVRTKLIKETATQTEDWQNIGGGYSCPYCTTGSARSSLLYSPFSASPIGDEEKNYFSSVLPHDLRDISVDPSLKCDIFNIMNL